MKAEGASRIKFLITIAYLALPFQIFASEDPVFRSYHIELTDAGAVLAAGDCDEDGWLDLAAFVDGKVRIFPGYGDGTFENSETNDIPASGIFDIELADLNGDGITDMISAQRSSYKVSVIAGLGNGRFAQPVSYFLGVGSDPGVIVSGDFTDDGLLDVAVASINNFNEGNINVLPGNGDLTLGAPQQTEVGLVLRDLVTGDLDGDGHPDLVTVSHALNTMHVLMGKEGGGFDPPLDYDAWLSPTGVTLGDFNGDLHLDAVTGHDVSSNALQLFLNNGDGTFAPRVPIGTPLNSHYIRCADLNDDDHLDLVTTRTWPPLLAVYLGDGTGQFGPAIEHAATWDPQRLDIADVDLDGKLDVAMAQLHYSIDDGAVSLYLGNGDGTLEPPIVLELMNDTLGVTLGDVNGDDAPDLVASVSQSMVVTVMMNRRGPWDNLGHVLPGTFGFSRQAGVGTLKGGDPFRFSLDDAVPLGAAYHVIGLSQTDLPFKGGVLVPSGDFVTGPFPLDGQGRFTFEGMWPAGVPAGTELYFQFWFSDPGGPLGYAASNAVKAMTP